MSLRFTLFEWIKLPFALFTLVSLIFTFYLTFNAILLGTFIPPIIAIFISFMIIKKSNKEMYGFRLWYNSFALAGVFLVILAYFTYKMFVSFIPFSFPNNGEKTNSEVIYVKNTNLYKYVNNNDAFGFCKQVCSPVGANEVNSSFNGDFARCICNNNQDIFIDLVTLDRINPF